MLIRAFSRRYWLGFCNSAKIFIRSQNIKDFKVVTTGMELEKFTRQMRELVRLEREAEVEEARLLQEGLSGRYLERKGVAVLKLKVSGRSGFFGRTVVTFETGREIPSHNITPGDIVGLSLSQDSSLESDLITSGVVSKVNQSSLSVAFDESQNDLNDLDDSLLYKLVKLAHDATYRRLLKILDELDSSKSVSSPLVNAMFGNAPFLSPISRSSLTEQQQQISYMNQSLDDSQKEAVRFAMTEGRLVSVVHGPPGTGKTTTVVEIIRQAVKRGLKVLVCAPSNIAVDNLVERLSVGGISLVRLGHPARVLPAIQRYSLDALLCNREEMCLVQDVQKDIERTLAEMKRCRHAGDRQRCRDDIKSLRKELRQREEAAVRDIMTQASVVLATLTMATSDGPIGSLDKNTRPFDLVVIDECSQSIEVACWIALLRGSRCVLAGDHHQLPPTIISNKAAKEGLSVTLMERLLNEVKKRENKQTAAVNVSDNSCAAAADAIDSNNSAAGPADSSCVAADSAYSSSRPAAGPVDISSTGIPEDSISCSAASPTDSSSGPAAGPADSSPATNAADSSCTEVRGVSIEREELMRMLTVQYRMNERIMSWASDVMYDGKLTAHQSVKHHLLKELAGVEDNEDTCIPLLLIDTSGCDLEELELPDGFSKANEGEADIATEHVHRLISSGVRSEDIAVISPYNLQVEILRLRLSKNYPSLEIKSVDGFQGREKEAVVLSLVRSNNKGLLPVTSFNPRSLNRTMKTFSELGFLTEDRRINVAVTRARRHVAVICDSDTVSQHEFLKSLIQHMTQHGEVRSALQYIQDGVVSRTTEWSDDMKERFSEYNAAASRTNASKKPPPESAQKKRVTEQHNTAGKTKKDLSGQKKANRQEESVRQADRQADRQDGGTDKELEQVLVEFHADSSRVSHCFPSTLTSHERFTVHVISERLGLLHISSGEGVERFIEVRKPQPVTNSASDKTSKHTSGDNTNKHTSNERNNKVSENLSENSPSNVSATKSKNQNKNSKNSTVNEKSGNSVQNQNNQSASTVIQREESVNQSEARSCTGPESGSNLTGATVLEAESRDKLKCDLCDKLIPTANLELHKSRCGTSKRNMSTSASSVTVSSTTTASSTAEEDFDSIIAAAIKTNSRCHTQKCRANVVTLGQDCKFCKQRFCLTHHLAEAHGCGDKAKEAARRSLAREGALYAGSGVPSKKPDPIKRGHLERKLEKRLGEMEEGRKKKGGEKKK